MMSMKIMPTTIIMNASLRLSYINQWAHAFIDLLFFSFLILFSFFTLAVNSSYYCCRLNGWFVVGHLRLAHISPSKQTQAKYLFIVISCLFCLCSSWAGSQPAKPANMFLANKTNIILCLHYQLNSAGFWVAPCAAAMSVLPLLSLKNVDCIDEGFELFTICCQNVFYSL